MRDFNIIQHGTSDLQRIVDSIRNAQLDSEQLTELYYEVEAQLKEALLKDHLQ